MTYSYEAAFNARADLKNRYGDNALLLFTLQLRFAIEDIDDVATNSLTDGRNDKKCDLVYIDQENGVAVIAQGYFRSKEPFPTSAPCGKASDLNTAVAWLFSTPLEELPTSINSVAIELREALRNGKIETIEFWYSHNLPESQNVANELNAVSRNAQKVIRNTFSRCHDVRVTGIEIGSSGIEELYQSLTIPILISDELEVDANVGFNLRDADWDAFITTVPAIWLYQLLQKHSDRLFSANIRGYLGSRKGDKNINEGIKQTALNQPSHFFIFNNGITAITNGIEYCEENKKLKLKGISIINGAQTTGALGSLTDVSNTSISPSPDVQVQARFIVCNNQSTIKSVIKYNNSQNKVEAPDFRSNDIIQKRLVTEFLAIPDAEYLGGRRGGSEDIIRRRSKLLPSATVGQSLTAFHGSPLDAYNRKSDIWRQNNLYDKVFNNKTTAKHIVFVFSLYDSLGQFKRELSDKAKLGEISETQQEQLSFFDNRGSVVIATTAIASCLEVILGRAIPDRFKLSFGNISSSQAKEFWSEIFDPIASLISNLNPAVENGLKGQDFTNSQIKTFRSLINATKQANNTIYQSFSEKVLLD